MLTLLPGAAQALLLSLSVCLFGARAAAGEFHLGLGADDITSDDSETAAAFAVDLYSAPLLSLWRFELRGGAALEIDTDADFWGGAGLVVTLPVTAGIRLVGSGMIGGYVEGAGNDLGAAFQIRSRVGFDVGVAGPWRLGAAFEHKSNGGVDDFNPGVETVFVTLGRSF